MPCFHGIFPHFLHFPTESSIGPDRGPEEIVKRYNRAHTLLEECPDFNSGR
jgi:hypothetical protein